jgi:hypothetical protein
LKTGGYDLVEASINDKVSGIVFPARTAYANRAKWEKDATRNQLGKALQRIRDEFQVEEEEEELNEPTFDKEHYNILIAEFWEELRDKKKEMEKEKRQQKERVKKQSQLKTKAQNKK